MKIAFASMEEFKQELTERGIKVVRRDLTSELEMSKGERALVFAHFVCYLTAKQGYVLLEAREAFYTTPSIFVEHEREKIKKAIEDYEAHLKKFFEGFEIKHGRIVEP